MPTPQIQNLPQAILATLCYFDIFDYPLTEFEVWRFLFWPGGQASLIQVAKELEKLSAEQKIETKNGFYFLPSRASNTESRLSRHPRNINNWKKSQKIFSYLSQVPYFKAAALCNMFSLNNQKETSDIDVFIVTTKDRIWSTRALTGFLTFIKGQWRHGNKIAKRFCLSFYITEDNLDLSFMRREPYDIYLIYWIATLAFIKDTNIAEKFFKANQWVKEFLPNFEPRKEIDYHMSHGNVYSKFAKAEEKIWNTALGKMRENFIRKIQLKKMGTKPSQEKQSTRDVKIHDKILKFHENDRRDTFREEFEKRFASTYTNNI
jgi:hypothetical protein